MENKETIKVGDTIRCIKTFWNNETQTQVKEGYIVKNMTQFGIDCLSHPECWEVIQNESKPEEIKCNECYGTGTVCYSCCGDDIKGNDYDLCPTCYEHCSLEEEECESCGGSGKESL